MVNKKKRVSRVVILGSKSFIAKSLINNLKKKNIEIVEVSRVNVDFSNKLNSNKLKDYIQDGDSIFFVAANAPVKNIEMLFENIQICQNICDAIKGRDISHIAYVSSDAVYKDSPNQINEESAAEPNSLHGLMHLTREKILESFFYESLCIIRPTLIYGKDDPHNGYGPNMFIRKANRDEDIDIFGKGEELRDHVWIEDVAEIISRLIRDQYIGKINITSGKAISFLEIANFVKEKYKSTFDINFIERKGPMPHNGYRAFNNDKLNSLYEDFNYKLLKDWIFQ